MRRPQLFLLALTTLLLVGTCSMQAGVITYTTQSAFNAATFGLSTQLFNEVADVVNVGVGQAQGIDNPLNITTNDEMLPGLSISAFTNVGGDIAVVGPNFAGSGLTHYSVFGNYPGSGLIFTFGPGVTAASLNVLAEFSSADVGIAVYDPSSNLLGSFTVFGAPSAGSGQFWGITSFGGQVIGSIELSAPFVAPFAGVDKVQFGSNYVTPEPSSLLLIGTGLLGAVTVLRRKINL